VSSCKDVADSVCGSDGLVDDARNVVGGSVKSAYRYIESRSGALEGLIDVVIEDEVESVTEIVAESES
jgi:hypothetical protein